MQDAKEKFSNFMDKFGDMSINNFIKSVIEDKNGDLINLSINEILYVLSENRGFMPRFLLF